MMGKIKNWANSEMAEWNLVCVKCGNKKRVADIGGIRLGGFSFGKRVLGHCSKCNRYCWLQYQRIQEGA